MSLTLGTQYYDFVNTMTLKENIEIKTLVGNVTTELVHRGPNLWIVNKFPWYLGGITQCICASAHEGGDHSSPAVGPINSNWTDVLQYVGREKINVEYDQGTHILDHWAYSAHHLWSFPDTGRIIRMWQPFNGLQVFPVYSCSF